jgi:hypothetical protein
MPTARQGQEFADRLLPDTSSLLEEAIDWIASNLGPADVFPENELIAWARNQSPEDVFPISDLVDWAEHNGFIRQ